MFNDSKSDAPSMAPVQNPSTPVDLRATTPGQAPFAPKILDALDAALAAGDVPGLQVLTPGLTKAAAHSLLFHYHRQAAHFAAGCRNYGAQMWGTTPPLCLLRGTRALRVVVLRVWQPELSAEDAQHVVQMMMGYELAHGEFWRWPIATLNASDHRQAESLLQRRRRAIELEMLAWRDADLARVHAATTELLDLLGLPFELLAQYAEGKRGQAGAVARNAETEAGDLRACFAYLPNALRG